MQQELRDLTVALQEIRFEMRLTRERDEMARQSEARDRENMLLRLENQWLRFEHRLPPPPGHSSEK